MVKEESLKSHSQEGLRRLHWRQATPLCWLLAPSHSPALSSPAEWRTPVPEAGGAHFEALPSRGRTTQHWHPVGVWHAGTIQPVLEEMLWFIKGSTNNKELSPKGLRSWDANGS